MGKEPKERDQAEQDLVEDLQVGDVAADGVVGGDALLYDVTQNKQKGALKSAEANDAYIRQ